MHCDIGLAIEDNMCTISSNIRIFWTIIVVHIERVVVGVVFGIGPCDRLGSKAVPVVHVEFGSGAVAPRPPIGLAHYFPSIPEKEVLKVPSKTSVQINN